MVPLPHTLRFPGRGPPILATIQRCQGVFPPGIAGEWRVLAGATALTARIVFVRGTVLPSQIADRRYQDSLIPNHVRGCTAPGTIKFLLVCIGLASNTEKRDSPLFWPLRNALLPGGVY